MKPQVKAFSRERRCTKADIWNCFRGPRGFKRIGVIEVRSHIGVNVPRVMERSGYIVKVSTPVADYYELTDDGKVWLIEGLRRFVRNHPAELDNLVYYRADNEDSK